MLRRIVLRRRMLRQEVVADRTVVSPVSESRPGAPVFVGFASPLRGSGPYWTSFPGLRRFAPCPGLFSCAPYGSFRLIGIWVQDCVAAPTRRRGPFRRGSQVRALSWAIFLRSLRELRSMTPILAPEGAICAHCGTVKL